MATTEEGFYRNALIAAAAVIDCRLPGTPFSRAGYGLLRLLARPLFFPAPPSRRYRGNNGGAIITAAAHDKEGSSRPRLASFLSALVGRPLIGLKVYRDGCRNGYCCPLPWNRRRLGGPTMAIGRKALVFFALGGREDGGGSRQRFVVIAVVVVVVIVVLSLCSSPSTNRRVLMHGPTFAR